MKYRTNKFIALFACITVVFFISPNVHAQTAVTGVQASYNNVNDTSNDYTLGGRNYTFNSGSENDLLIFGVEVGSLTYTPAQFATRIDYERVPIGNIPPERQVMFYEGTASSSSVNLKPGFAGSMKEILLSPILNRGVDNIFQHTGDGSGNVNNIQRLDFFFDDGLTVPPNVSEDGFIVMERGGNDPIKIALITSLDANGKPASFGPVVSAQPSDWGNTGFSLRTQVMRSDQPGAQQTQTANLNPQNITGILFTFSDLGASAGQTIYGYSLTAGDAPSNSSQWLDVSTFPTDTDDSKGGLDLLAGGAFFSASPVIEANDNSYATTSDVPLNEDVSVNDVFSNGSEFTLVSNPSSGTLQFNNDGTFTYIPDLNFDGQVEFDYEVCLPAPVDYICDTATVTITIDPPLGPIVNLFPAAGFGTLAFEDLWPSLGDYDFNDLVIDYQFEIHSDVSNFVESVDATFIIKAFGAGYQNGFGFQLSDAINPADIQVTGYSITENYITLNSNGTEAGQSKPTIIVFDNAFNEMEHPGVGVGVNTEPTAPYVQPKEINIQITFPAQTYTLNDLNISSFNPFLIVNLDRGVEVHLPGYPPTDLVDLSLFGTQDDDSDLSAQRTYVSHNNLPWAINIYHEFDYPIEKQDIIWVHLKFVEWAESGGVLFPDWYKDKPGYRNNALIYQQP